MAEWRSNDQTVSSVAAQKIITAELLAEADWF
jgi:hypothetical protein